jgi:hypothetical protein
MPPEERDNTVWCKTADEAIKILWDYKNVLTKVMLEHDLGGEDYVNIKRNDCGMEIVRFLEGLHKNSKKDFFEFRKIKFTIHTWNAVAGIKMSKRLKALDLDVHYVPFGMTGEMNYGRV